MSKRLHDACNNSLLNTKYLLPALKALFTFAYILKTIFLKF